MGLAIYDIKEASCWGALFKTQQAYSLPLKCACVTRVVSI